MPQEKMIYWTKPQLQYLKHAGNVVMHTFFNEKKKQKVDRLKYLQLELWVTLRLKNLKKILHIISPIFFVIIELLYVVACFAVRNFLKFVLFHESNTSSCYLPIAS